MRSHSRNTPICGGLKQRIIIVAYGSLRRSNFTTTTTTCFSWLFCCASGAMSQRCEWASWMRIPRQAQSPRSTEIQPRPVKEGAFPGRLRSLPQEGLNRLCCSRSTTASSSHSLKLHWGFPDGASGKEPAYQRPGFDPWVRMIPWRRKWRPTPVILSGGVWQATVMVSQRVGHDLAHTHARTNTPLVPGTAFLSSHSVWPITFSPQSLLKPTSNAVICFRHSLNEETLPLNF